MARPGPRFDISHFAGRGEITPSFRADVIAALNTYPYFTVLTRQAPEAVPFFTVALATSLTGSPQDRAAMTIAKVAYAPEIAAVSARATNFSRTANALEAHTDGSYMLRPHELVAFQFVQVDPTGGDTIILPIEDVLERISDKTVAAMASAEFFFGNSFHTILTEKDGRRSIRYYRVQLDQSAGGTLRRADRVAIADEVSAAVSADHQDYRFHAEPGETVLINNTKCLHSRTAFDEKSDRLMFRVRAHSPLIT